MNSSVRFVSATISVIVTAALATWLVVAVRFWSDWNWFWVLAVPLVLGVGFFRRSPLWLLIPALAWLATCSFLTFLATASSLGIGE